MRILIHSKNGDVAGLALRFQEEGHQVWVYIELSSSKNSHQGMIPHVNTMQEGLSKNPDFVLFDREGNGLLAEKINQRFPVIGANSLADKIELDRDYGLKVMRMYGIRVPDSESFKDPLEAIKYVKENQKAYAVKPNGNIGASLTYVGKDVKDTIDYLNYFSDIVYEKGIDEFVLQEVVKGVEISTEVWFSRGVPISPANGTIETKRFLPGDLGPNTGNETSVVFPYKNVESMLVRKTLSKLFPLMKEVQWTGPLDINCIVSEKDHEPYALEFTARLGYSAIYALASMIENNIAKFFYGVAMGSLASIPIRHSWGTSIRLSIPPYPFESEDRSLERQIFKETEGQRIQAPLTPFFYYLDAKKDKKGRIVTAGIDGAVGECTSIGYTLLEAWRGSQELFKSVNVPNKQGRLVDGSDRAFKDLKILHSWGYDVPSPSPVQLLSGRGGIREKVYA